MANKAEHDIVKLALSIIDAKQVKLYFEIEKLLINFKEETGLQAIVEPVIIPSYGPENQKYSIKIRVEL